MLQSLTNRSLEHRHGSLLAISHAYYRKIKLLGQKRYNCPDFKKTILVLSGYLSEQQPLLVSAACKGLALIGSVACLPLPDGKDSVTQSSSTASTGEAKLNDSDEQMQVDSDEEQVTKVHVANTILGLLKSAHSRPKIREEAAICLGYLCLGDGEFFTLRNLKEYVKMLKLVSHFNVFLYDFLPIRNLNWFEH